MISARLFLAFAYIMTENYRELLLYAEDSPIRQTQKHSYSRTNASIQNRIHDQRQQIRKMGISRGVMHDI